MHYGALVGMVILAQLAAGLSAVPGSVNPGSTAPVAAAGSQAAYVLHGNGDLLLESPLGTRVPAPSVVVDRSVKAFQQLDGQTVLVLGADSSLWLESGPFGVHVPPSRVAIDRSVASFQAMDASHVFLRGNDKTLWLEFGPFGTVPPPRQQLDGGVASFQAVSLSSVYVLGGDAKLWLESGPFGVNVPPARAQLDASVAKFQGLDTTHALILGSDGYLWLEFGPFGRALPPPRQNVDASVASFQAVDVNNVYVLGHDGAFWLDAAPFGVRLPPARSLVDLHGASFQALDAATVFLLGSNGLLWLEFAPFGSPPPARVQVDSGVSAYQGTTPPPSPPPPPPSPPPPPPPPPPNGHPTSLSAAGTTFVAAFEGFCSQPYNDATAGCGRGPGNCAIGYGHLISVGACSAADIASWGTISQSRALQILQADAQGAADNVHQQLINTPLAQSQFDALVDFAFNIGNGNFNASTVNHDLQASPPNYADVPRALKLWDMAGGHVVCGLYSRRVNEGNLFTTGSYTISDYGCPAAAGAAPRLRAAPASSPPPTFDKLVQPADGKG